MAATDIRRLNYFRKQFRFKSWDQFIGSPDHYENVSTFKQFTHQKADIKTKSLSKLLLQKSWYVYNVSFNNFFTFF